MSNSFPGRKILPVRSRRSLGGERQSVSSSDQGQPSTLPISADSLRATRPPETSPASGAPSPPRSDSATATNTSATKASPSLFSSYEGGSFSFGDPAFGSPAFGSPAFGSPAFGSPAFGRTPTLQADAMKLPSVPDPQPLSGDSSLPIPSRLESEGRQSLHTLFYDKKIAVTSENDDLGMPIPVLLNGSSPTAEDGPSTPPPTRPPLWGKMFELGSSPSLHPNSHMRSVSATSSISDISYYSDPTSPYDVGSEEPPPEPFFSSPFQTALQRGLDIAKDVVDAMEAAGQSLVAGSDLQRLITDAKELSTFKSSETRTIAVLGDSGEGKSSLINSLLHFPDIAKTGDIGAACTSVVTEYRLKTTENTAPIAIEVEYLSMGEIEDLVKELVWNYRRMYLPGVEGEGTSESEYATMQRESEQAWSSLHAGFSHQSGFNKDMLINDVSETGLSIVNSQLVQWAHELDWPDSGESGKWVSTAHTADECCEKTSVFMEDRFWPFTKIIRVYLEADVLRTGIVLADLPGLHDTNLARVKATQDYLLRCDHIFIVAKISRAITDQSLQSSLYSVLSRHASLEWAESGGKSMKVAVVCTKSEDIDVKAARKEFCGPKKAIPKEVMAQLDKDIKDAKAREKNTKDAEARGNRTLKKQLKQRQQLLLINARNTYVKDGLQRAYSSKVPDGRLEVFCISNKTYGKFVEKGNAEMVQASGIPELRRFCYTMTAHSQLLEAKNFLSSMLSSLLNSAELLATKPAESQQPIGAGLDESILLAVDKRKVETLRAASQSKDEFQDTFREVILTLLDKQSEVWERAAEQTSNNWNSWHWTQYNAWCRHDGSHYTEKRGEVNWNAELIWKMRMEMAFQWDILEESIPQLFQDLLQSARAPLLALQSEMREKGFSSLFVEGIDFRIRSLKYRCSLAERNFAKESSPLLTLIRIIRSKASEPNESSYMFAEMVPAYRSAANEYGTGKNARQRNTVQGRITNGVLFPNISRAIKREIKSAARTTFDSVQKSVESDFALIEYDLAMALASTPQQPDHRDDLDHENDERLKGELASALQGLKRQHAEVLASIANL